MEMLPQFAAGKLRAKCFLWVDEVALNFKTLCKFQSSLLRTDLNPIS